MFLTIEAVPPSLKLIGVVDGPFHRGNIVCAEYIVKACLRGAAAGLAWVILSLTGVLSPQYYDKVFTFTQPAVFGELAFMLWLVIKGTRPPALDAAASSAAAG